MHKQVFRKGRSTIGHILTLHAAIEKQLANKAKLYVAFTDFKIAYDTVNRHILWSVLFQSGIQGRMLTTLKAMYNSVQACVMCNSEVTGFLKLKKKKKCFQGLKQGCVASPVLFSLLIIC